jgi:hypothetical protein
MVKERHSRFNTDFFELILAQGDTEDPLALFDTLCIEKKTHGLPVNRWWMNGMEQADVSYIDSRTRRGDGE